VASRAFSWRQRPETLAGGLPMVVPPRGGVAHPATRVGGAATRSRSIRVRVLGNRGSHKWLRVVSMWVWKLGAERCRFLSLRDPAAGPAGPPGRWRGES
jgi:hypothetical protein